MQRPIERRLGREDPEEIQAGVLSRHPSPEHTLYTDRHEADASTEEAQLQVLDVFIPVILKFVGNGNNRLTVRVVRYSFSAPLPPPLRQSDSSVRSGRVDADEPFR